MAEERYVEKITVDESCKGDCANCERYFQCNLPLKYEWQKTGWLPLAKENLKGVKYKLIVVGGKGGVGKSMLAVAIACALRRLGKEVCILDQNYDCPAIATMCGVEDKKLTIGPKGFIPVVSDFGVKVVSMGNVVSKHDVIMWYSETKRAVTEELLCRTDFGELDYLIIDVPAGTSAETVNAIKYIPDMTGAVVVTVPTELSQEVARRAILLMRAAGVPVLGVVENMGPTKCPYCGAPVEGLSSGGGKRLAERMGCEFLGVIPMDYEVSKSLDEGRPFVYYQPEHPASKAVMEITNKIVSAIESRG
ncbi:ATP-binding protein [Candidatus Geothermarchaeota archaeon ex4572_27]|nr:MAG: ATP-binding protein [Candidatus Geothermarchaeota archaeon ex4572_27]